MGISNGFGTLAGMFCPIVTEMMTTGKVTIKSVSYPIINKYKLQFELKILIDWGDYLYSKTKWEPIYLSLNLYTLNGVT